MEPLPRFSIPSIQPLSLSWAQHMASTIRQLTEIIANNVEKITAIYENAGVPLPSLDEPSPANAALPPNAEVFQAITLVQSAASQLLATILPTPSVMMEARTSVCFF